MSKPNYIEGMSRTGIGRAGKTAHLKKQHKSFTKHQVAIKKAAREKAVRVRANREYAL